MSIFNEEDRQTVKVIGYWAGAFAVLTVGLIVLSLQIA